MPDQPPVSTPAPTPSPAPPGTDLGKSTAEDFSQANNALDDLLKAATAPPEEGAEPTAEEKAAEEKAAADEKAAKEAADKAAKETPPAAPTPEEKAAADKEAAAAKETADKAAAKDDFDKVELPPYTKPKSVEAFATVKTLARERIAAVEAEKTKLAEELSAAKEAAAKAVKDPAVEKELAELRDFRLKFDVEADPSFKTWDKTVKENEEMIYARLKAAGVDDAAIKKIQELGGPSQVDWDSIAQKFPATLKRYIEGKLFENEDLAEKKKQAIEKAKANASEFVRTRQEEIYKGIEGRQKETEVEFNRMLPELKWLKETPVPAAAKPEEKAKIEADNATVKKIMTDVQEALNDDSPAMRAILVAGFAQLMRVRADSESDKARHSAEIAKLTAEIKEKDAFIARIKKSSSSREISRGSPETPPAPKSSVNEEPMDALDRHLKEVLAAAGA